MAKEMYRVVITQKNTGETLYDADVRDVAMLASNEDDTQFAEVILGTSIPMIAAKMAQTKTFRQAAQFMSFVENVVKRDENRAEGLAAELEDMLSDSLERGIQ